MGYTTFKPRHVAIGANVSLYLPPPVPPPVELSDNCWPATIIGTIDRRLFNGLEILVNPPKLLPPPSKLCREAALLIQAIKK